MNVEQNYIMNKTTIAIIPAKEIDYDPIIVECESLRYIKQTPQQIIEVSL